MHDCEKINNVISKMTFGSNHTTSVQVGIRIISFSKTMISPRAILWAFPFLTARIQHEFQSEVLSQGMNLLKLPKLGSHWSESNAIEKVDCFYCGNKEHF